jgi:putative acetyltransferase
MVNDRWYEMALTIRRADPGASDIRPIVAAHLAHSRATTPQTSCHTMTVDEMTADTVLMFWAVHDGTRAVGCGALKPLGDGTAEVKSVHVIEDARGRGIARLLMVHLADAARALGHTALVLETGSERVPGYDAARALYQRLGYRRCGVLPGYRRDPNSVFLRLDL